jgi:processive 1,2-diacylglycerol beta-glucosyltransferase
MKVLIISVSAGAGHVRAAQAIADTAALEHPELEIEHIDMMNYVTRAMRAVFVDSYSALVRHAPEVWKAIYDASDNTKRLELMNKLTTLASKLNARPFLSFVSSFNPDVIVCTHPFPAQVIRSGKGTGRDDTPIALVVTDYAVHGFWMTTEPDRFFVATQDIKQAICNTGFSEKHVTVSGIPVDPVFFESKDVHALKKNYGFSSDRKNILVLAGGQGLMPSDHVVRLLLSESKEPYEIVAISGKNNTLFERLRALKEQEGDHILHVVEWTDRIDEYMRMADCIITKSGGITTTECMTLGKHMIITNAILGQEECNAKYAVDAGCASIAQTEEEIVATVESVFQHPQVNAQKKDNAARVILNHLSREF